MLLDRLLSTDAYRVVSAVYVPTQTAHPSYASNKTFSFALCAIKVADSNFDSTL